MIEISTVCQVKEDYSRKVKATAAGFVRTAYLALPWVRVPVNEARALREKRVHVDNFKNAEDLEVIKNSLLSILPGNGVTFRAASEDAERIFSRTCYPNVGDLLTVSPRDGSLVIDAKNAVQRFFDEIKAPIEDHQLSEY